MFSSQIEKSNNGSHACIIIFVMKFPATTPKLDAISTTNNDKYKAWRRDIQKFSAVTPAENHEKKILIVKGILNHA